jgi:hypothetical protein
MTEEKALAALFAESTEAPNRIYYHPLHHAAGIETGGFASFGCAASLRIADILIMVEDDPRRRSSSDTRQALEPAGSTP